MRHKIREHAGWFWGIIGVTASVLGFAVAILPNLRDILETGWLVGWSLSLILGISWAANWRAQDRSLQRLESEVIELKDSLSRQRDRVTKLDESVASHRKELETMHKERTALETNLESARIQVRSLQKPTATDRDKQLFARLGKEWPWKRGTLHWLGGSFNAKSWSSRTAAQVVEFADIERETRFDDAIVNASLVHFRDACGKLSQWLTGNSFSSDANPDMQVVPVRGEAEGFYISFKETRDEGFRLANEVVDHWRLFERTGRARGL